MVDYAKSGIDGVIISIALAQFTADYPEMTLSKAQAIAGNKVRFTDSDGIQYLYRVTGNSAAEYVPAQRKGVTEPAEIKSATVSVSPASVVTGTAANLQASCVCDATDDGTYSYQYILRSNPFGLVINASTGVISGTSTATAAETVQVGCNVTDSFGTVVAATNGSFNITMS
ncbi:hypothetical protein J4061_004472 [Salmonella enterica]|nr:hypothetical protein [Salmonella enterica]